MGDAQVKGLRPDQIDADKRYRVEMSGTIVREFMALRGWLGDRSFRFEFYPRFNYRDRLTMVVFADDLPVDVEAE